jgi:hypothetical protein
LEHHVPSSLQLITGWSQKLKPRHPYPAFSEEAYDIAMVYLGLGEKEQAYRWLEKGFEERSPWMVYLNLDPRLDGLRADPRFQELAHRVGLPPIRPATAFLIQTVYGNTTETRQSAAQVLKLAPTRQGVGVEAALAFAIAAIRHEPNHSHRRCRPRPGARCSQDFSRSSTTPNPDIPILKQGKAEYAKLR